jgi:para-nitrobenzyl esterase
MTSAAGAGQPSPALGGTSWQLVRIQYMDDKVVTPDDRTKYTVAFGNDGRVSLRIDCNRGSGAWKSGEPGQLVLGPLAVTRAMCPAGSLFDRVVKDMGYVRSYLIKEKHLFLSLMADGGIYEFEPLPKPAPAGGAPTNRETPSFDCARATGTVEKMICGDAGLAKLDRELAGVYAAAVKKAGTSASGAR